MYRYEELLRIEKRIVFLYKMPSILFIVSVSSI